MLALIDSDILVYRVGAVSNEDSAVHAKAKMDTFIENLMMLDLPDVFDFELHLTGSGNFRKEIAVTVPYKGNRKDNAKPVHYDVLRKHLVDHWCATVSDGIEADDKLAMRQHELTEEFNNREASVIVTLDKDLNQVEGWHYNFVKDTMYDVTKDEAVLSFYKQFLTGDRIDNIVGVKGIGDVKATKLLQDLSEPEMWAVVVEHLGIDRAIENGHLLYMLRHEGDSFIKYLERNNLSCGA